MAMVNVTLSSLASQAPTGARGCLLDYATLQTCGSWPASDGDGECGTAIAGKSGSHRARGCLLGCATPQICGSWLASDSDGECGTVIAGKPGSHRARGFLLGCATPQICGSWLASDGDGECGSVIAGKPGSYRVMRMRRRALRVRRMESISAAQLRPTIRPCHSPLGPLGSPNQLVRPSA